jgi:predicted ATP-grasp superfamily ATP-dependent carboligase
LIRVLILGAGGAAGVNFTRALRRSEVPYYLIGTDVNAHRLLLPDLDERHAIDRADSDSHGDSIRAIVDQSGPDLIYAQADSEVRYLIDHPHPLATMLPAPAAWRIAGDKMGLNAWLDELGIPVPRSIPADNPDAPEVFEELRRQSGKVWVRARTGAGSKAALPVATYRQMANWIDYWCEFRHLRPADFMMCEFLPGDDYAHQSLWHKGRLVTSVARQRLEYVFGEQMPSGQSSTPSVARIVHNPTLNALAESAVKAIDPAPNGVYGVDCKTDAAGMIRVTEINVGRFYTTSDFYAAAGCNLPDLLVRAGLGLEAEPPAQRDPIRAGVTWIRSLDREAVLSH